MSGDAFPRATAVVHRSAIVRATLGIDRAIRAASARSRFVAAGTRGWRSVTASSATERVRLSGILLLTASIVHAVLQPLTSIAARPIGPHAILPATIVLAVVLIAAAPAVARAWPRARLRRLRSRD